MHFAISMCKIALVECIFALIGCMLHSGCRSVCFVFLLFVSSAGVVVGFAFVAVGVSYRSSLCSYPPPSASSLSVVVHVRIDVVFVAVLAVVVVTLSVFVVFVVRVCFRHRLFLWRPTDLSCPDPTRPDPT